MIEHRPPSKMRILEKSSIFNYKEINYFRFPFVISSAFCPSLQLLFHLMRIVLIAFKIISQQMLNQIWEQTIFWNLWLSINLATPIKVMILIKNHIPDAFILGLKNIVWKMRRSSIFKLSTGWCVENDNVLHCVRIIH